MKSPKIYIGSDVLVMMSAAKNYNLFLEKKILSYIKDKVRKINIIDFGAGRGQFCHIFKDKNVNLIAIEENKNFCEYLRENKIKTKSLSQIKNDSIDYIYSINVLEHIKDDQKTINQLFSKLTINGKIYIYVPAFELLWSDLDDEVGHFRRYGKKEIINKLKKAGFREICFEYADSAGFFVTLLYKVLNIEHSKSKLTLIKIFDRYIFPIGRILDILILKYFFGKNISINAIK